MMRKKRRKRTYAYDGGVDCCACVDGAPLHARSCRHPPCVCGGGVSETGNDEGSENGSETCAGPGPVLEGHCACRAWTRMVVPQRQQRRSCCCLLQPRPSEMKIHWCRQERYGGTTVRTPRNLFIHKKEEEAPPRYLDRGSLANVAFEAPQLGLHGPGQICHCHSITPNVFAVKTVRCDAVFEAVRTLARGQLVTPIPCLAENSATASLFCCV